MRQIDFISLIHKELTGELSPEESMILLDWLKSDQENQETYEDVKIVWEKSALFEAPFVPNAERAFKKQLERINSEEVIEPKVVRMKPVFWASAVAAGFAILLSALVIWNMMNPSSFNADEEIVNVELKDGSSIWINKGSKITLADGFGKTNRDVILSGEAYFDIARNEDLPFIISAGAMNIEVLGTEFNVRSYNFATNSVAVKEGRVQVKSVSSSLILTEGEYAQLTDQGILNKHILKDNNEINWKDNQLTFDDTPLIDVVEDLSSFFNTPIEIKGQISECPITYTKPVSSDIESILLALSKVYDMTYSSNPSGGFTITSVHCD